MMTIYLRHSKILIFLFYEFKLKVINSSVSLKYSQNNLWSSSSIILQITPSDCPRMGNLNTNGHSSY